MDMTDNLDFTFNNARFYGFELFDHDLILFCDKGSRFEYENLTVIGGRASRAFDSERLSDIMPLDESERRFLSDFLCDSGRRCAFLASGGRIAMVFNNLYRSCGLGVAVIFDYSIENIGAAIKSGMLEEMGDGIYSPSIVRSIEDCTSDPIDRSRFTYSALRLDRSLSMTSDHHSICDIVHIVSSLIGCDVETEKKGSAECAESDLESASAILLCLLSICRRHSLTRSARIYLDCESAYVKFRISFSVIDAPLTPYERECMAFCEHLASRIELPLSIVLSGECFLAEFIPFRVDPSLYGLKAGVKVILER